MFKNMDGQACEVQTTPLPAVTVPAMAYIPFQQYATPYSPEQGLDNGTIFPDLHKPFYGRRLQPK